MDSVEFQGNRGDLDRFALHVLKQSVTIDKLSAFEHHMRWDTGSSAGSGGTIDLRSGIRLSTTKLRWDQPWSFRLHDASTSLKFMLGRGAAPRITLSNGTSYLVGGGALQVRHATQALSATCDFAQSGAEFEQLTLEVAPAKLREMLGTPTLPRPLERLVDESRPHEMHEQPMAPVLSRLLDEIVHADARSASRSLFLEAKGLELLAALTDELTLASEATAPLTRRDIERLECAQRLLRERMVSPPSLPELARLVGLNEYKLKAGFRALFGIPPFAYLRAQRLEYARQLLARRELSVTEVAARVGYENPSKFAAAFRRHFGLPPSALR